MQSEARYTSIKINNKNKWISGYGETILFFLIFVVISSVITMSISVFCMQVLLACITLPLILKKEAHLRNTYLLIFIVSLFFVFMIYLGNKTYYGNSYYLGGSDDLHYEESAILIYQSNMYIPSQILDSGIIEKTHNSSFFVVYISLLIRFAKLFTGYTNYLPRIVNVYILIWVCMLLEYFLKKYGKFSAKSVRMSIALFALTPNIQYINAHVFRDSLNLLQILLLVYLLDRFFTRHKYFEKIIIILLMIFILYILYYTRSNSIVFAGALCGLVLMEKFKIKKIYFFILPLPLAFSSSFLEKIQLGRFVERYSSYVLDSAGDGLSSFVFNKPIIPFGIILRALYAFITPFPNFFGLFNTPGKQIFDIVMLFIYLGVIIQIVAIPFILKRMLKFDWVAISFLIFFISIIVTTFTFRHIILYYPFMVALGVDGYMTSNKLNRTIGLLLIGISGFLLAIVYLILKFF